MPKSIQTTSSGDSRQAKGSIGRYTIGIDLGTSNIALSYLDTLQENPQSQTLLIDQLSAPGVIEQRSVMPSFLYLALEQECQQLQLELANSSDSSSDAEPDNNYVVGTYALNQTANLPSRVIASAKSWLCHGGVDREEKILPWLSDEIASSERLSPVEASAEYLKHLAKVWNAQFAEFSEEYSFNRQDITITVPASFDEVAQQLTLQAAALAGYPLDRLRLLEEPQAALYHWLEKNDLSAELVERNPELANRPAIVLVCDVGGGTSDFSLFEITPAEDGSRQPGIERIAVSDHILLGGDNIDLTIAHLVEPQLIATTDGSQKRLSGRQWNHLVNAARKVKEQAIDVLSASEHSQVFRLAVPAEGGGLFSGSKSASITRREVVSAVIEGFFPRCLSSAEPVTQQHGLSEWGLPYAADSGVTRYLAQFLAGRRVDAVLYNGGTLSPAVLTARIQGIIAEWQEQQVPIQLQNSEKALAVARGAACYGFARIRNQRLISAGYARSLYLEVAAKKKEQKTTAICLLPLGFEANKTQILSEPRFKLLVGQPARFQLYSSTRRSLDRSGELIEIDDSINFHKLPDLQAALSLPQGRRAPRSGKLEVQIECKLTETGLLEIYCQEIADNSQIDGESSQAVNGQPVDGQLARWQLSFNLRNNRQDSASRSEARPGDHSDTTDTGTLAIDPARLEQARKLIAAVYGKKHSADEKSLPRRLLKDLESAVGEKRGDWNTALLRHLWETHSPGITRRGRSLAHETSWLSLAGYLLRPGYGVELDQWRIDTLWRCFDLGLSYPKEASALVQWWLMWRRTAGGLSAERQELLYARIKPLLFAKGTSEPELVRLAGALERLPEDSKRAIGSQFVEQIAARKVRGIEHYIWAFGRLSTRVPLYSSPHTVVRPGQIELWCQELFKLDWTVGDLQQLPAIIAQACRYSGDRERDISEQFRLAVLDKLQAAGANQELQRVVREFVPLDFSAQSQLFGEQLPIGLHLA